MWLATAVYKADTVANTFCKDTTADTVALASIAV